MRRIVVTLAVLLFPLSLSTADANLATNIVGPGAYAGAGVTCQDQGACDQNPTPGVLQFQPGLGGTPSLPGYSFSLQVSQTGQNLLDTSWNESALSGAGGTLQITTSATGFTARGLGVLDSALGGTCFGNCSVTGQQWANNNDYLFGLGPITAGAQGPFATTAFSDEKLTPFDADGSFSMTDRLLITLGAGGLSTGDFQSHTRVPMPSTLLLLGGGMLSLGFMVYRRR
jgi:hypothetical protein